MGTRRRMRRLACRLTLGLIFILWRSLRRLRRSWAYVLTKFSFLVLRAYTLRMAMAVALRFFSGTVFAQSGFGFFAGGICALCTFSLVTSRRMSPSPALATGTARAPAKTAMTTARRIASGVVGESQRGLSLRLMTAWTPFLETRRPAPWTAPGGWLAFIQLYCMAIGLADATRLAPPACASKGGLVVCGETWSSYAAFFRRGDVVVRAA